MTWSKVSRHERGYGTAWEKLRLQVFARDAGICQPCQRQGLYHPATEVDHIVPKSEAQRLGWPQSRIDAMPNLQSICKAAHAAKTAAESGRPLTNRQPMKAGPTGWPVPRAKSEL